MTKSADLPPHVFLVYYLIWNNVYREGSIGIEMKEKGVFRNFGRSGIFLRLFHVSCD